jgi:hypothetical protein
MSLKQCVGHSITKTIIEMAQRHISLTLIGNKPAVQCGGKLSLKKFYELDPGFSVIVCAAQNSEKIGEINLENEFPM